MAHTPLRFQSEIRIFKPRSLRSDPAFRSNLNDLINNVYKQHEVNNPKHPDAPKFGNERLSTENQLEDELGPHGLIAVLIDNDVAKAQCGVSPASVAAQVKDRHGYGGLVAVASLKPWRGRYVEMYLKQLSPKSDGNLSVRPMATEESINVQSSTNDSTISEWEVATCASLNTPKYRGTGCVSRCVDALRLELVKQRNVVGDHLSEPLRFFVTVSPGLGNDAYWKRRGYVQDGALDVAPVGMWGSSEEFDILTMAKIVA